MVTKLVLAAGCSLGLPDLDRIREIIRRVQEIITMGGVALAALGSLMFVLVWALSHVRSPSAKVAHPLLSTAALVSSYIPVGLTCVAALGIFMPVLAPYALKAFAIAILFAALSWCLAVAALILGGSKVDLGRARRALLLAGTPWYCLALWLSTHL